MVVYEMTGLEDVIQGAQFPLGRICFFHSILTQSEKHRINPLVLLQRHATGDHGSLDDEDVLRNESQITWLKDHPDDAAFIMSNYPLGTGATRNSGDRIWIITRTGRILHGGPFTEVLCPEDY